MYLLSSIAQSLAATVALAATLPLAFAGLSRYLAGAAQRLVLSYHFLAFIGMYVVAALVSLIWLCLSCMRDHVTLISFGLAAGCLGALPFYILWIADRLDPGNYIDSLVVRADRVVREAKIVAHGDVPTTRSGDLRLALAALGSVASAAATDGVTLYVEWVQFRLLQLWMTYDFRRVDWVSKLAEGTWLGLVLSHSANDTFVHTTVSTQDDLLLRECVAGRLALSEHMVESLSGPLGLVVQGCSGAAQTTVRAISAVTGLWILASVAHHLGHSVESQRKTARSLAIAQLGLPEQQLADEVDRVILRAIAEAEHSVSRELIEPDIRAFAGLVRAEHSRMRSDLGAPPGNSVDTVSDY